MKLHTKYQGLGPSGFRQEDFFRFPFISVYKTYVTRGGVIFGPRAIILTILTEVDETKLCYKYQMPEPSVSDKKVFKGFAYINL